MERGNEYLMLHRTKKENDLNRDKWLGVGGKFEASESPEDCVLREVREETGLTLTRFAYRGIVTFVSEGYTEYMHLFTADKWVGEMSECNEGDLEWISKDRLFDLTLWEGDRVFLSLIKSPCPFFSLKLVYPDGSHLSEAVLNGKALDMDVIRDGRYPRLTEGGVLW